MNNTIRVIYLVIYRLRCIPHYLLRKEIYRLRPIPTTGATAGNILGDSATGKGKNTGDRPDSLNKGIAQVSGEKFATGIHNVDGKKSGVKTLSKQGSGYPGNNKNAGPVGSGSGDKAGQTSVHNTPSPLNGAPNRNS